MLPDTCRFTSSLLPRLYGHAQLTVVPDAAHRVFTDNPEVTHDRIRAFLAALS